MPPLTPIPVKPLNYAGPPASKIRLVALLQKSMIISLMISFALPLALGVAKDVLPPISLPLSLIASASLYLLACFFALKLGLILFEPRTGVLLALATLLPVAGLVYFSLINARATAALQRRGIKVRNLGAKMSDLSKAQNPDEILEDNSDLNT